MNNLILTFRNYFDPLFAGPPPQKEEKAYLRYGCHSLTHLTAKASTIQNKVARFVLQFFAFLFDSTLGFGLIATILSNPCAFLYNNTYAFLRTKIRFIKAQNLYKEKCKHWNLNRTALKTYGTIASIVALSFLAYHFVGSKIPMPLPQSAPSTPLNPPPGPSSVPQPPSLQPSAFPANSTLLSPTFTSLLKYSTITATGALSLYALFKASRAFSHFFAQPLRALLEDGTTIREKCRREESEIDGTRKYLSTALHGLLAAASTAYILRKGFSFTDSFPLRIAALGMLAHCFWGNFTALSLHLKELLQPLADFSNIGHGSETNVVSQEDSSYYRFFTLTIKTWAGIMLGSMGGNLLAKIFPSVAIAQTTSLLGIIAAGAVGTFFGRAILSRETSLLPPKAEIVTSALLGLSSVLDGAQVAKMIGTALFSSAMTAGVLTFYNIPSEFTSWDRLIRPVSLERQPAPEASITPQALSLLQKHYS